MNYEEFIERLDFYSARGIAYEYERCGNSIKFDCPGNGLRYFISTLDVAKKRGLKEKKKIIEELPLKQLHFISTVRRHIEKNKLSRKIKPNYKDERLIKYFVVNEDMRPGDVMSDAYSVDITKAYWRSAQMDGWVDDAVYAEGLGVNKRVRLASLGSFAKSVDVYRFDGREEKLVRTVKPKHPQVFLNQANRIYKLMEKCRKATPNAGDFAFYWTDGLYVRGKDNAALCAEIIKSSGFESETKKLRGITRRDNRFVVKEYDSVTRKTVEKNYFVSTKMGAAAAAA